MGAAMKVHDLSGKALAQMLPIDLAAVNEPPNSPIGEFAFNDSTCGIGCFVGQPPWECHTTSDELLHVLVGETYLATIDDSGECSIDLGPRSVVVISRGRWHRNSAPGGVTMLCVTPSEGNLHSWAEQDPRD
jgi:mannose-6-phosphate isomerase-like protein (cupin superfamily)